MPRTARPPMTAPTMMPVLFVDFGGPGRGKGVRELREEVEDLDVDVVWTGDTRYTVLGVWFVQVYCVYPDEAPKELYIVFATHTEHVPVKVLYSM